LCRTMNTTRQGVVSAAIDQYLQKYL
jgi:hypothetical protein